MSSEVGTSIKIRLENLRMKAASKSQGQFEQARTNGSFLSFENPSSCWSNSLKYYNSELINPKMVKLLLPDFIRLVVSSSWLVLLRVIESTSSIKIIAGFPTELLFLASLNNSRIFLSFHDFEFQNDFHDSKTKIHFKSLWITFVIYLTRRVTLLHGKIWQNIL